MNIIKIPVNKITPYENNAKIHTEEQIEQIKRSIEQFGMNDPIAVWGENNIIVEGHGRLEALKQLGHEEVECIRLDHLTDEERRAYTLAHNKLTMNTDFDFDKLEEELRNIETINMEDFDFNYGTDIDWASIDDLSEDTYEKPEKDMLECPKCHHVDLKIHFRKLSSGMSAEDEITDEEETFDEEEYLGDE